MHSMRPLIAGTLAILAAPACHPGSEGKPAGEPVPSRTYDRLDSPDMQRLLFHPRKEAGRELVEGARRVKLKAQDGSQLRGRVHVASPSAPLILLFYGNGEIAEDYRAVGVHFRSKGLSLLVLDYRGYGASSGTPSVSGLLGDARWIFDHRHKLASKHGLRPSAFYILGRSLGSAAAIEVAAGAGEELDGLILDSAFADTLPLLRRLGYPDRQSDFDENADGVGNLQKMRLVKSPVLLIHGELDQIIPIEQSVKLYDATQSRPRVLLRIPRAGHNNVMNVGATAYFEAILELTRRPAPSNQR